MENLNYLLTVETPIGQGSFVLCVMFVGLVVFHAYLPLYRESRWGKA